MTVGPEIAMVPCTPSGCGMKVAGSTIARDAATGTPTPPAGPKAPPAGGCEMGICSDMEYVPSTGTPNVAESACWLGKERAAAPERIKRRLWAGVPPRSSKCLTISMWMVGTAEYQVGRGSAAKASTMPAEVKAGKQEIWPPAARLARMDPDRPPMWKRGITFKQTSDGPRSKLLPSITAFATSWPCRSGTPLGVDVVPDVRRRRHTSSARRGTGAPDGSPSLLVTAKSNRPGWVGGRSEAVCTRIGAPPPRPLPPPPLFPLSLPSTSVFRSSSNSSTALCSPADGKPSK
mmetsp:Transcript_12380/g.39847  ORF Transcript_12380/g.39847 Transcript_12380/m.39847 type:complete len:290 (-) Transcript_12380:1633-2502(-)